jgi:hypothetical protein
MCSELYKQVGPSHDQMRALAGATDKIAIDSLDSTSEEREARKAANTSKLQREPFVSKIERNFAASAYNASLKGKTGQERKEIRAELMDPGPSDDAAIKLPKKEFNAKTPKNYEAEERKAIQSEGSAPKKATQFKFGANKGSTKFNFGHNKDAGHPAVEKILAEARKNKIDVRLDGNTDPASGKGSKKK